MSYSKKVHCNNQYNTAARINKSTKQTNVKIAAGYNAKKWEEPIEAKTTKKCPMQRAIAKCVKTIKCDRRTCSFATPCGSSNSRAACRPELRLLRRRRQLPPSPTAASWDYVLECECGALDCSSSKLLGENDISLPRSCVRVLIRN